MTASAVIHDGYIGLDKGKISFVGSELPHGAPDVIDHRGMLIFPGAVDAQVHSRSQKGREGFSYSTKAAAAGGVTTIVDMPYDEGLLVCNAAAVNEKASDIARQAHVDVALYGTIHPQDGTARMREQVEAGVCAFKLSTFGTHPERFPRIAPQLMFEAFKEAARFDVPVGVHNENDEVVRCRMAAIRAEGRTDYMAHGLTHTPLSELLATVEIYELGAASGCAAHVVHCSLGRGIDICESYKRQGFAASVEVCIHYLLFSEDTDVREKGGLAKINPPIRPATETGKLWSHLQSGNIDIVSTDHVAWSLDRKNDPNMLNNASGGPSLEVLVPALIKGCIVRGINLSVAARVLAANPARHFGLDSKGELEVSRDADFSIIDPAMAPWRASHSQTVSDWSLYDGMELPQVRETWLRGEKIWDGSSVLNADGDGHFIRRFAP